MLGRRPCCVPLVLAEMVIATTSAALAGELPSECLRSFQVESRAIVDLGSVGPELQTAYQALRGKSCAEAETLREKLFLSTPVPPAPPDLSALRAQLQQVRKDLQNARLRHLTNWVNTAAGPALWSVSKAMLWVCLAGPEWPPCVLQAIYFSVSTLNEINNLLNNENPAQTADLLHKLDDKVHELEREKHLADEGVQRADAYRSLFMGYCRIIQDNCLKKR